MKNLHNLENSLKKLKVKPRLSFKIKLTLLLYSRMLKMRYPRYKLAFSGAVLAVLILFIGGIQYQNYYNSYEYYVNLAERDVNELALIFENKPSDRISLIPIAIAAGVIDQAKVQDLIASSIFNTDKAINKINELTDIARIKTGLMRISNLHAREITVFAMGAEILDNDNLLNQIANGLQITIDSADNIRSAYMLANSEAKRGVKRIALNVRPYLQKKIPVNILPENRITSSADVQKILSHVPSEDETEKENRIAQTKTSTEEKLKQIIQGKNEKRAYRLSGRYISALNSLEKENRAKANALLIAIQAESKLLNGEIGLLDQDESSDEILIGYQEPKQDDSTSISNLLSTSDEQNIESESVPESKTESADEQIPSPANVLETASPPFNTVDDLTIIPPSEPAELEEPASEEINLTPKETIAFVNDLIEASSTESAVPSESSASEGADIPLENITLHAAEIAIFDKASIWKKGEEQNTLAEESNKIEEEKKKIDEEQNKQDENNILLKAERNKIEMENEKLAEEQEKKAIIERQKIEEEQKKNEKEKKLLDIEARKREEEKKRLELIKKKLEEETRIADENEQKKRDDEKKRIEIELQKRDEQKRIIDEQKRKIEEEQSRLEREKIANEKEKEQIRKELEKKKEEEKRKIEEALKREIEEKTRLKNAKQALEEAQIRIEDAKKAKEEEIKNQINEVLGKTELDDEIRKKIDEAKRQEEERQRLEALKKLKQELESKKKEEEPKTLSGSETNSGSSDSSGSSGSSEGGGKSSENTTKGAETPLSNQKSSDQESNTPAQTQPSDINSSKRSENRSKSDGSPIPPPKSVDGSNPSDPPSSGSGGGSAEGGVPNPEKKQAQTGSDNSSKSSNNQKQDSGSTPEDPKTASNNKSNQEQPANTVEAERPKNTTEKDDPPSTSSDSTSSKFPKLEIRSKGLFLRR